MSLGLGTSDASVTQARFLPGRDARHDKKDTSAKNPYGLIESCVHHASLPSHDRFVSVRTPLMGGLATLNDVIMGRELAADPARQPGQAQLGKTGRRLSVLMV